MRFILRNKKIHQIYLKMQRNNCRSWHMRAALLFILVASGISRINTVPTDGAGTGSVVVGDGAAGIAGAGRAMHSQLLLHRVLRRDVATMAASLMQEESKDATSTETTLDQPQGQCLLDGVLVAETTVFCEKQVGCRAIQKTGHCCPDYKCDCQKDGKTYLNGDKLVDPETPCTVCYCQGGEILCSSVSCFHRDDCTPKYVPGRCCPEYDNCPVAAPESSGNTNKTIPRTAAANTAKPEVPAAALNPKITIKEITKPTEIRITDDNKAIPIHQMLAPTTSTSTTTTTTTTTPTTTNKPTTTTATAAVPSAETPTAANVREVHDESFKKAAFGTDNNQKALPAGGINNESLKLSASVAYPHTPSAQPTHTNTAKGDTEEIGVAKNGNGHEKPISVFSTQGLQRIESESANETNKVNIKREYLIASEGGSSGNTVTTEDFKSSEILYATPDVGPSESGDSLRHNSAELDPDTAGSDNIYHIILTTDGPTKDSTTRSSLAVENMSPAAVLNDPSAEVANDTISMHFLPTPYSPTKAPETMQASSEPTSAQKAALNPSVDGAMKALTTTGPESMTTERNKATSEGIHHLEDEDIATPMESNPAYPSLPEDDFSLRDVNFPLSETDDVGEADVKDESRSISAPPAFDAPKDTKKLDDPNLTGTDGSGSGSGGDMLVEIDFFSTTDRTGLISSTEGLTKVRLMYSSEESSAETAISNSSDFQLNKSTNDAENETGSGESLEFETIESLMGNGSGSGEPDENAAVKRKTKQREPTTPRPTRPSAAEFEIDEVAKSADNETAPLEDPKLDVESLKLDETRAEGVAKADAVTKGNVLTVNAFSGQDKTAEEADVDFVEVLQGGV